MTSRFNQHPWSFDAAVFARYFDTKSEKLGDDFRGYIFQNQPQIDKSNLRQYVDKFANDNKAPIPFVLDPDGQLKAKIMADREMGTQIGLQHTPTIFVVGSGGAATPAVEVEDRTKLDQIIEDMLQKSPAAPAAKNRSQKDNRKEGCKEIALFDEKKRPLSGGRFLLALSLCSLFISAWPIRPPVLHNQAPGQVHRSWKTRSSLAYPR